MREEDYSALAEKHGEAEHLFPHVRLSLDHFIAAAVRTGAAEDGSLPIAAMHLADLYLAAACLERDPAAVGILERDVMQKVRPAVERTCREHGGTDDAMQSALQKLLVGPPEPKLLQYTARGPLVAWVRVIAVREALQAQRRTNKEVVADRVIGREAASTVDGLERQLLRDLHGAALEDAVQGAMRRLEVEQRAILRFSLRDGLSIDQIAPLLGVHRATAARRLERARQDVLSHTIAFLAERHGMTSSEARSLCLALGPDLDLSLGRALPDEGSS